jgi:hypothetical protein
VEVYRKKTNHSYRDKLNTPLPTPSSRRYEAVPDHHGSIAICFSAVSSPPSGPASNLMTTRKGSASEISVGTPTEAEQNVPQANPDFAELSVSPSPETSLISHIL